MAKNRDIISYYLKQFPKLKSDHESVQKDLERDLMLVIQDYADEIENIKSNYQVFEDNHLRQYLEKEQDFSNAIEFVDSEYKELFDRLDIDFSGNQDYTNQRIEQENIQFKAVINNINELKKQAHVQFLELTKEINKQIDHEMKVHFDFIDDEDGKFKSVQKNYQEINSEQANRLLWTIEESKNALIDLGKQLQDNSFQHAKYMNESVLNVLESLRETKNKMTVIFKATTDLFSKQKSKIERLNHERQKPHSLLNQTIIRQYVKQIREVNQKKTSFDQMIRRELKKSLDILGKRILDFDEQGNRFETEKAIMQYEIVQKKAEYLLHRNEAMSELLISKYQNEIKKIKIDSFRRVEEIKLAYFMPATFFQNSINLYSNFAFYVNESFDDLDNLLTDLISFNQKISDVESNYIRQSAKTVEDYKIKVMVQVNNVTTKLTDLITKIDILSKNIITLESRNQLEVAEIRKKMESTEINGDYQKYLVQLDNDEYFACYQHDINMQLIKSETQYKDSLLLIDKNVTSLHKQQQIMLADQKHMASVSLSEKTIHDLAYDRELAFFYATYDKDKLAIKFRERLEANKLAYSFARYNYLFAKKYDLLRQEHIKNRQDGSQHVVEYVYNTQKLIDLNELQTKTITEKIGQSETERDYAYYLELMRENMIKSIIHQTDLKTDKNRQAVTLYHHHFYETLTQTSNLFNNHTRIIKRLLVHLDNDFALNQGINVINQNAYTYSVCYLIEQTYSKAIESITDMMPQINVSILRKSRQEDFETYVILAHSTLINLKKSRTKKNKTRIVLENFYIKSLHLFKNVGNQIQRSLHKAELAIIKNDVLFIEKINEQTHKTSRIVNNEFDTLIYRAVRMGKKKDKKVENLAKLKTLTELELKNKVKKVNVAYMDTMKNEADKITFVKKEIVKIIKENENALLMQKQAEKVNFRLERKFLDKKYSDFVKAYQRLKSINEECYLAEINFVESMAVSVSNEVETALLALDKKIVQLPSTGTSLAKQLEADKQVLVEKRRFDLLQQLALIEGSKFTNRPKYLKEIEAVKQRLPEDYLGLYQQMQKAETEFLQQYTATEASFEDDFRQFLQSQQTYRRIIDEDSVTAKPFEKYFDLQKKLLDKTQEAYSTNMEKSGVTKSMIKAEETKSKDRQNRIING